MSRRALSAVVLAALAFSFFIAARRRVAGTPVPFIPLSLERSFAITDPAILDGFSFERVMNTLVEGTNVTALALYQQWWDTQNAKPGRVAGNANAPHCDDFLVDGRPAFNGFPRRCPTPEGALAVTNPFTPPEWFPIGVMNRFDLTPPDGANCGQYRMLFARRGAQRDDRLHLIFEAVLPNPNPSAGLAACRPVAEFWASLTSIDAPSTRRAELERFFFQGLPGFAPVVQRANFSLASGGGIRSLQHDVASRINPRFYQFRLETVNGAPQMQPDVLENMPIARLFDADNTSSIAVRFREEFLRQLPGLALRDVNLYFMNIPREYLMAESDPVDGELAFIFSVPFNNRTSAAGQFRDRVDAELRRLGSTVTSREIVVRAETQSCVGCHFVSGPVGEGVVFPRSASGHEHVTEEFQIQGENGPRFAISPAMQDVFIPHRMQILRDFLTSGKPPVHSN